jgi:hypothetical protein
MAKNQKRYPIFPVRLRPDDKEVMTLNVKKYDLRALSDSIRVATCLLKR